MPDSIDVLPVLLRARLLLTVNVLLGKVGECGEAGGMSEGASRWGESEDDMRRRAEEERREMRAPVSKPRREEALPCRGKN